MSFNLHPPRARRLRLACTAIPLLTAGVACADDPIRPAADAAAGDAARNQALAGSIGYEPASRQSFGPRSLNPGVRANVQAQAVVSGFVKVGTFFRTDVTSAGVGGMRDVGTANLDLSGVSGNIARAFLYWHAVTNTEDTNVLATVSVDGSPVTGTNIGFSDDNCWGYANSQAWMADVTDRVRTKRNGRYALSGFGNASTPANTNGASLIVIYQDGNSANDRDVVLYHGNDSNMPNQYDADGWNVTLNDIVYGGGAASMELHVADGQVFNDGAVFVNGETLLPYGPNFQGNTVPADNFGPQQDGRLWDIRRFDIVPYLQQGSNDLALTIGANSEDCLALVAAVIDLPGGAAPTPPFVFVPNRVSLTLSKSINVYLFSASTFDATLVTPAETRMYIDGGATGAPVARRGTAYLTATGDYNGDGRADRLLTFLVSDLVAAGLTASSSSFVLADRTEPGLFEGQPDIPPQIVP